jgi:hypothetical protein
LGIALFVRLSGKFATMAPHSVTFKPRLAQIFNNPMWCLLRWDVLPTMGMQSKIAFSIWSAS